MSSEPNIPLTNFKISFHYSRHNIFESNTKGVMSEMPPTPSELRGGPRNEFCDVAEFNDYIFQDKCWGVLEYMESTEGGAVPRAQRLNYLMAIFSPKIDDCRDRLLSNLYISGHKLMKKCGKNLDMQVGIVTY